MNTTLLEFNYPSGQHLQFVRGDITTEPVDAIVNAANEHLSHGGGVAWIISKQGGPNIQKESNEWVRTHGPVSHAAPAWTSGGLLPAKFVIHAVGPVWGSGEEDAKLAAAISGTLRVANELGAESIAFPAISTGIFGFPKKQAAAVILKTVRTYCATKPDSTVRIIKLVLYDQSTIDAFLSTWNEAHIDA